MKKSSSSSSSLKWKICFLLLTCIICIALYFHFSLYFSLRDLKLSEDHSTRNSRVITSSEKKKNGRHNNHHERLKIAEDDSDVNNDDDKTPVPSAPPLHQHQTNNKKQHGHHGNKKKHAHHHHKKDDEEEEDAASNKNDNNINAETPPSVSPHHDQNNGDEEASSPFVDDSPVQEIDSENPITSLKQLKSSKTQFFVFREEKSGKYLARPLNTLTQKSKWRERIFRIQYNKKYSTSGSASFTIRGHTRLFLTSEINDRVTIDRLWARSFEQWHFDFKSSPGFVKLKANRNNKYVSVFKSDGGKSLETIYDDASKATKWKLFPVASGKCEKGEDGGEHDDYDENNNSNNKNPEVECWGADLSGYEKSRKKSRPGDANRLPPAGPLRGPLLDSLDTASHLLNAKFPLFGSPKPLPSSTPKDPHDHFDTVVIAERTIRNWASMDGMLPIMFSDDTATVEIVQKVNDEISEHKKKLESDGCVAVANANNGNDHESSSSSSFYSNVVPRHLQKHETKIEKEFEIQKKFKQPTYRGLFKKALELYPDAPAVMYSNGDILFSPTLAQTIRRVATYFEKQKRVQPKLRGWMIVGQRVNCVVPAEFTLRDLRTTTGNNNEEEQQERYFSCKDLEQMKKKVGISSSKKNSNSKQQQQQLRNFSLTTMPQWVLEVEDYARNGQLFQANAEDYFIVSRDMFDWDRIPDFVVGGVAFDNWITGKGVKAALKGEAIMVDAVKTITALHQNDDNNVKKSHIAAKSRYNLELAASNGGIHSGYTADAPHATERLPDGTVTIYDKHALLFN